MELVLEIGGGIVPYCVVTWVGVYLAIERAHRRHRRRHGEDYYGSSGELGVVVLAPLLPLLLPVIALLRLFDR